MHGPTRTLLTRQEHERCQAQLAELCRIRDRDLPGLLREARTFVASDAVEEIAQIQDDATVIDARIARLELLLRDATVVDESNVNGGIAPGHVVTVLYTRIDKEVDYVIGADPMGEARAVSMRSPVGQALLGRGSGETVTFELPNGRNEEVRVVAVSSPKAADGS